MKRKEKTCNGRASNRKEKPLKRKSLGTEINRRALERKNKSLKRGGLEMERADLKQKNINRKEKTSDRRENLEWKSHGTEREDFKRSRHSEKTPKGRALNWKEEI